MFGRLKDALAPTVFLTLVLTGWEAAVWALDIPAFLLPSPSTIVLTLFDEIFTLARHTAVTMLEAILGFSLANALGFLLAVIFARSPMTERAVIPYAIVLKTTPVIALAPCTGSLVRHRLIIQGGDCCLDLFLSNSCQRDPRTT